MKKGKYPNGMEYVDLERDSLRAEIEALGKILQSKKIKSRGVHVDNGAEADMRNSQHYKTVREYMDDIDELLGNDMIYAEARFELNGTKYDIYYVLSSGRVFLNKVEPYENLSSDEVLKILNEIGFK